MFNTDVIILHIFGDLFRLDEHLAEIAGGVTLLRTGSGNGRDGAELFFNGEAESAEIDVHLFKQRRNQSAFLVRERLEQVNGADLLMTVFSRNVLGCDHRFSGFRGKFFHVHKF